MMRADGESGIYPGKFTKSLEPHVKGSGKGAKIDFRVSWKHAKYQSAAAALSAWEQHGGRVFLRFIFTASISLMLSWEVDKEARERWDERC